MDENKSHPKRGLALALLAFLVVFVVIPLAVSAYSLVGRLSGEFVMSFEAAAYARVPKTADAVERVLAHGSLSELLADPSLASINSAVSSARKGLFPLSAPARFLLNGSTDAALFADGSFLASYDAGFLSPWLRLLPLAASRADIEGLSVTTVDGQPRFAYRSGGSRPLFACVRRNLIIVANDEARFAEALSRADSSPLILPTGLPEAQGLLAGEKYDAALYMSSDFVFDSLASSRGASNGASGQAAFLDALTTAPFAAVGLSVYDDRVVANLAVPVASKESAIASVISRKSPLPRILSRLPEETQYSTIISAGDAKGLLAAVVSVSGTSVSDSYESADRASSAFLGVGLEELLFSWMGDEFAAFGLEGRPKPVFAVRVADERKRKEIFDLIVSSILVSEDTSTVLDGIRLPRITLPSFLDALVRAFGVQVPSPYYAVEDGVLFLSESAENLAVVVSSLRKGESLVSTESWKDLASGGDDRSHLSLFYSLDRTVPFFLKGNSSLHRAIQLYRQGLLRARFDDGVMRVSLSLTPGSGSGVAVMPGFPVPATGRLERDLGVVTLSAKGDARLVYVADSRFVVSYNPKTGASVSVECNDSAWVAIDPAFKPATLKDSERGDPSKIGPALWVVTRSGEISLLSADLEPLSGYPVASGFRPSASPVAFEKKLYLVDRNGSIHVFDASSAHQTVSLPFTEELRSPPSILSVGKKGYMAMYPKSFSGSLWLTDLAGAPLPNWPASISGIGFASPLLFARDGKAHVAFITQAGELTVLGEDAGALPGFPVRLPGLFYAQGLYDGEFLWYIAAEGIIYKVSLDGEYLSHKVPDMTASEGRLSLRDIDDDGEEEVFASGDGSILHGYSRSLSPLAGFPLPLWGFPSFADINGDGKVDCVGAGLDDSLNAWIFR